MKKIVVCVYAVGMLLCCACYSQERPKKDTLYYLLDTMKTFEKDRLVSVQVSGYNTFVTINCRCVDDSLKPVYRFNNEMGQSLSKKKFQKIKLTTLSHLIDFARNHTYSTMIRYYVFWFVVPAGDDYVKYQTAIAARFNTRGGPYHDFNEKTIIIDPSRTWRNDTIIH